MLSQQNRQLLIKNADHGKVKHKTLKRFPKMVGNALPNLLKELLAEGFVIPAGSQLDIQFRFIPRPTQHKIFVEKIIITIDGQPCTLPGDMVLHFKGNVLSEIEITNDFIYQLATGAVQINASEFLEFNRDRLEANSFIDYLREQEVKAALEQNKLTYFNTDSPGLISRFFNNCPDSTYFDQANITNQFSAAFQNGDLANWLNAVLLQAQADLLDKNGLIRSDILIALDIKLEFEFANNSIKQAIIDNLIGAYITLVCELVTNRYLDTLQKDLTEKEKSIIRDTFVNMPLPQDKMAQVGLYFNAQANTLVKRIEYHLAMAELKAAVASNSENAEKYDGAIKELLSAADTLYQQNNANSTTLARVFRNTASLIKAPTPKKMRAYNEEAEQLCSRSGWKIFGNAMLTLGSIILVPVVLGIPLTFFAARSLYRSCIKTPAMIAMKPLAEKMHGVAEEVPTSSKQKLQ